MRLPFNIGALLGAFIPTKEELRKGEPIMYAKLLFCVVLVAASIIVAVTHSCRSPMSINLNQYTCANTVTESDGTLSFSRCIGTNGDHTSTAEGGSGDDKLDFKLPEKEIDTSSMRPILSEDFLRLAEN